MRKETIDMHVHFGAPGNPETDPYFWSEEFTRTPAFAVFRLVTGLRKKPLTFERIREKIIAIAEGSDKIDRCVLLALDKAYDEAGKERKTHLFVANSVIAALAAERPDLFLFGASVHPFNPRWGEELRDGLAAGAVLCKWIPSAQRIDPSHPACLPFYRTLAAHKLPLLCHAGPEQSVPPSDPDFPNFDNPKFLVNALEAGVPVIVAHCALPFEWPLGDAPDLDSYSPYQELLELIRRSAREGWEIYADLSALLLFRDKYLHRVVQDIPAKHLLFGSDYPILMLDLVYKKKLTPWVWIRQVLRSLTERNLLDKNYDLIQDMGFDPAVFTNAGDLFARIRREP